MNGELVFAAKGPWFWLGCGLMLVLLTISGIHCVRQGWQRRTLRLELLRFCAVAIVLTSIAKPEWWQALPPTTKPILALMTDASGSMDTPDMPEQETRRAWLERQRSLPLWLALAERFDVQWQSFESSNSHQTDLHQALVNAGKDQNELAAIVLFSDGDSNAGKDPVEAARTLGIPIHSVVVGKAKALPDLAVELLPMPKSAAINEPMNVPFRLTNRFEKPQEITVTFTVEDVVIDTKTLTIPPRSTLRDRFVWKPNQEGDLRCQLRIPVVESEVRTDNNQDDVGLSIRQDQIKVLLVDSEPRWEFRYLRNALMRDPGVEVATILFHNQDMGMGQGPGYLDAFPSTPQDLSIYDVVFLGDVGISNAQLRPEDATRLSGLVEKQSSGLVFVPGRHGHYLSLVDSALGPLIPVALDSTQRKGIGHASPSELELTEFGRENVLTLLGNSPEDSSAIWRSLPGFYWHAPVIRSKAGSKVLAVHGASRNAHGRLPLLVTRPFGRGKTLFLGCDGAWRWRRGVEDKYHYRFWGQVARWMAYQRNLAKGERARLIHYPDPPKRGHAMQWHATVFGEDLGPFTEGSISLQWQCDEAQGQLALVQEDVAWGTYMGEFTPKKEGIYSITLRTNDNPVLQTTITVAPAGREVIGSPANPRLLSDLAKGSGGKVIETSNLGELEDLLQTLPSPATVVQRTELWGHAFWLITIIAVLTAFWIERKRAGLL